MKKRPQKRTGTKRHRWRRVFGYVECLDCGIRQHWAGARDVCTMTGRAMSRNAPEDVPDAPDVARESMVTP
jgi:hypothetical protein